MKRVCGKKFFDRDTLTVARELLGKFLVRRYRGREIVAMITEVEAYDGFHDKASHASRGITARNAPMFGPAGKWYAYLTYGMHWMLNVVTREKGYPAAILIRGMDVVSGPARLTKYFHIDKKLNAMPANRASGLWVEDRSVRVKNSDVARTPRIGVTCAGKVWAGKNWRFLLNQKSNIKNQRA